MTLKPTSIFILKPLIQNFEAKFSAATEFNTLRQIICLVHINNDIFFRYAKEDGQVILKLLPWFNERYKVIQDICFDGTGKWLLVLCDDNTLHVVPALSIVDKNQQNESVYSNESITSYIIPFVGPHECPNPRTCPNNFYRPPSKELEMSLKKIGNNNSKELDNQKVTIDELYSTKRIDALLSARKTSSTYYDKDESDGTDDKQEQPLIDKTDEKITFTEFVKEFNDDKLPCPYPTCLTWWQTQKSQNRAVIGYSDGSICFVSLTPNCPFLANTFVADGAIEKLYVCRDIYCETTTLLIQTSTKTQWKLLLEQKSIGYIFPGYSTPPNHSNSDGQQVSSSSSSSSSSNVGESRKRHNSIEHDWQIIISLGDNFDNDSNESGTSSRHSEPTSLSSEDSMPSTSSDKTEKPLQEIDLSVPKIFPGARAKLQSLRDMGAKKIGALKQKLTEAKLRSLEYSEKSKDDSSTLVIIDPPGVTPEILTSPSGPYFIVQSINKKNYLAALHKQSDTLSVHSMDINLMPLFVYKTPQNCNNILLSNDIIFTIQEVQNTEEESSTNVESSSSDDKSLLINACGVVSRKLSHIVMANEEFDEKALVSLFPFANEKILNIHRMLLIDIPEKKQATREETPPKDKNLEMNVSNYVKYRSRFENINESDNHDTKILQTSFPPISFERCFVVTDKNTYNIELADKPEEIFMNFVHKAMWSACEYFCDIFNVSYQQCIEYAGDELLKQKKVTQALVTYNVVRVPPIKTALKLGMFGESNALLHLCAMALKAVYILKSRFPTGPHMNFLMKTSSLRNVPHKASKSSAAKDFNTGVGCSDYCYQNNELSSDIQQMSFTSQFHLSNLLFLTLCEKTIADKNYMPLWNFIVTNNKFHTHLSSTILAQSGLYSSAILLAKTRGSFLDVFNALVSAISQEFGSDINYLMYNLADDLFKECLTYSYRYAVEYFKAITININRFSIQVLERLASQLNPFDEVYRPIVSKLSARNRDNLNGSGSLDEMFSNYCKLFIEAYLTVLIKLHEIKGGINSVVNALTNLYINHEENQTAFKLDKTASIISAGFAHSACVVDGISYIWGSNTIPYAVDVTHMTTAEANIAQKSTRRISILSDLGIKVYAVQCGRTHTLLYTNNGLYAMGANQYGQLGVGSEMSQALQPVLVRALDGKCVTQISAGQYHNAVVADGDLYTWGWGVFGQLGHNNIDDIFTPKLVEFFKGKIMLQLSLGHAHTLVLCREKNELKKSIYVFGSNYFGQLGLGFEPSPTNDENIPDNCQTREKCTLPKSMVPVKLMFHENIRLIHTKYFCSFAVTESNALYTWGSSPQALRLINQARKRAKAMQKSEQNKENEANNKESNNKDEVPGQILADDSHDDNENGQNASKRKSNLNLELKSKHLLDNSSNSVPIKRQTSDPDLESSSTSGSSISPKRATYPPRNSSNTWLKSKEMFMKSLESPVNEGIPVKKATETGEEALSELDNGLTEWTEHLYPSIVDTGLVNGDIIQMSSGLYHFGLRTATGVYTWGKNLEKQLGNEGSRADVLIPTELENFTDVDYIECGADFTLILTKDKSVLAFGNNNQSQCGKMIQDKTAMVGKWVRLKISKRHIRIPDGSLCVDTPYEINLPRPMYSIDLEPVMYLKSLPKYREKFIRKSPILNRIMSNVRGMKPSSSTIDSNLNDFCNDEMLGLEAAGSALSLSNDDNRNVTIFSQTSTITSDDRSLEEQIDTSVLSGVCISSQMRTLYDSDMTSDFIHYCLYIFHGIYDNQQLLSISSHKEFIIRLKMLDYKFVEAFRLCLTECENDDGDSDEHNPSATSAPHADDDGKEYVDDVVNAQKPIKIFEYFTKDENLIPMHTEQVKYFIQDIFMHFIDHKLDLKYLEAYFLKDLDFYIMQLAYVLFFNNNNTELEGSVLNKYRLFFSNLENTDYKIDNSELIFANVSNSFNAIVCQRLIEIFDTIQKN